MNKISIIVISAVIFFSSITSRVFAEQASVQKALENVKEKVDDLVTAKDENTNNDLTLRIEAFRKVIDFSIAETKDLKLKLLSHDQLAGELAIWKQTLSDDLNTALKYYEEQKQNLAENETVINLESIKDLGQRFKTWRDEDYLTTSNQINDFLLIQQEKQAVQIAKKRYQKISEDINKIQKAKIRGASDLVKLLNQADRLIKDGDKINQGAENLFNTFYLIPLKQSNPPGATSSVENLIMPEASSTQENSVTANNTTSTATSTDTTMPVAETSVPSIKDSVKDSLAKIRGAYQIFIEMSNLVRKLLK